MCIEYFMCKHIQIILFRYMNNCGVLFPKNIIFHKLAASSTESHWYPPHQRLCCTFTVGKWPTMYRPQPKKSVCYNCKSIKINIGIIITLPWNEKHNFQLAALVSHIDMSSQHGVTLLSSFHCVDSVGHAVLGKQTKCPVGDAHQTAVNWNNNIISIINVCILVYIYSV